MAVTFEYLKLLKISAVLLFSFALINCAQLGSAKKPVNCTDYKSQEDYVSKLIGPDGKPVSYLGLGKKLAGNSYIAYNIIKISSQDSTIVKSIYLKISDNGYQETQPIKGFTLAVE